ncbi:MAG: hypothetical protein HYU41_13240 [Candidatus Rokubacteria bacterium]|nr:hypothetical protein [Candidatus Rokubacteria bacterium]
MLTGLVALAFVVAGAHATPAHAQGTTTTLKMQASWPVTLTLFDNFKMFAERVDKRSGGRLKIETLPAGTVVPAFEVLDATNKKVIDGAHTWAAYWTGKHKAAVLFTGGPGGTFGMDFIDVMGWTYEGGGWRQYAQKVVPAKRFMFPPYSFAANYYWPEKKGTAGGTTAPASAPKAKPAPKPADKKPADKK